MSQVDKTSKNNNKKPTQRDDGEADVKIATSKLVWRLLKYTLPYKGWMILGCIILLILTFAYGIIPMLVKSAIDQFIQPGLAETMTQEERIAGLTRLSIQVAGAALLMFVTRALHGYLMAWIGQHTITDLRRDVFAKILSMHLRFFDTNPVGRLMTRITSDLDSLQRFVTDGLIGLAANIFMLSGIIIFMIVLNWKLALLLFTTMPLLVGSLTFINIRVRRAHRTIRERQSSLNTLLQENISGMSTVQLFSQEARSRQRFDEKNMELYAGHREGVRWFSFYFPSINFINAIATVLILVVGGIAVMRSQFVEVGTLVAFFLYIRDFFRPLEELSDKSHLYQTAMASSERIFGLMDEVEELEEPAIPIPLDRFNGEIEFKNVSFAYIEGEDVIRDLSFHVKPGQSLALVGATGAGKTSIISLVARFYDVQQGQVMVDGNNVRDYTQSELRRRIGIVLQDPFVFSSTVAMNISMDNPKLTREDVIEAAKYVNAHDFITRLPNGYDTELGERGAMLSTGQKQLLALARAIVQDPDIMLILDEATANVDTETEQLIQEALKKVMKDRTSIVIAHRLSTIKDVDQIIVMHKGRLKEKGTHNELLKQDGYYRKLFELLAHSH